MKNLYFVKWKIWLYMYRYYNKSCPLNVNLKLTWRKIEFSFFHKLKIMIGPFDFLKLSKVSDRP